MRFIYSVSIYLFIVSKYFKMFIIESFSLLKWVKVHVPCDFIKQDGLQKLLSVHYDVLARPLEESTDWLAPS